MDKRIDLQRIAINATVVLDSVPCNVCQHEVPTSEALLAEAVDYVVFFDEPDPGHLIETLAPDVLVKGSDWASKGVIGQQFVESRGGRVVLVDLVEGFSTTAELDRIRGQRRK